MPEPQHGIDGFKEAVRWVFVASPDLHYDTEDIVGQGDQVMARLTFRGIHEGEYWGISPIGKRIAVQHMHWCRFADGRIVEYRAVRDNLDMLQRLGVVPMLRDL
jgi:predicted ester cyclase